MAEITNEVMDNTEITNEVAANEGIGVLEAVALMAAGCIIADGVMKFGRWAFRKTKKLFKKDEIAEVIYDEESEVE